MLGSQERILIVEDEEDLGLTLKSRLESAGYEVHVERNGSIALSYVTEHWPDLVVLDLGLPDLDGFEVCAELRGLCESLVTPIMIFTGSDDPLYERRGFLAGANAYLSKRCSPEEFLRTIEHVLQAPAELA